MLTDRAVKTSFLQSRACRKTAFYDTETDLYARASCQKAPLFDTRESIGEKSVAHVPGFFVFLLKSGFARKVL